MGADDCQRIPALKCLLLRKVGKANIENFEDLRQRLFGRLPHEFSSHRGVLTFANGSRIIAGHFQAEKDIDSYLGLEYDVIGIEEATTLSARKHQDIVTCCRTSKSNWRPRVYSTTNPGGVGHAWYKAKFITPFQQRREIVETDRNVRVFRSVAPLIYHQRSPQQWLRLCQAIGRTEQVRKVTQVDCDTPMIRPVPALVNR